MDRVKRTVKLAVCSAVVHHGGGAADLPAGPRQLLLSFFDASAEMLAIGSVALRIISISFLLAGFCIMAGSVCQAIGNPFYSLIVSVCPPAGGAAAGGMAAGPDGPAGRWCGLAFPIAELMSLTLSIYLPAPDACGPPMPV